MSWQRPNNKYAVRKYKQKHKELGLCVNCSHIPEPGRIRCKSCLGRHNAANARYARKKRKEWRENGRCTRCGLPLFNTKGVTCINCRQPYIKETQYATNNKRHTIHV
jgi:hypothetical protein